MTTQHAREARDWRPAYVKAAESLRDRILSGEFEAGSAIPSEPALAEEYGISRTSIRNAVRQLRDWGLIETRQGAGTYVLPRAKTLFDGVAIDGRSEAEKAVATALLDLDPRYIQCRADHDLGELLHKGRIPIVHGTAYLHLVPHGEPDRWLNALLWRVRDDRPRIDTSTPPAIICMRTDTTPATTAARAIHAVITA